MLLAERHNPHAEVTSGFRLRVQGEGAIAQFFVLPCGKSTIGSSPRCNFRLQQPGVQPLHLLLVHEGGELSVRRWAADSTLNGEAFEEASLRSGDCLSVGPLRLEIDVWNEEIGSGRDDADADLPEVHPVINWGQESPSATEFESAPHTPIAPPMSHDEQESLAGDIAGVASNGRQLGVANMQTDQERGSPEWQAELTADQLSSVKADTSQWGHSSTDWDRLKCEWDRVHVAWAGQRADIERRLSESETRISGCLQRIDQLEQGLTSLQFAVGPTKQSSDRLAQSKLAELPIGSSPNPTDHYLASESGATPAVAAPAEVFDWAKVHSLQSPSQDVTAPIERHSDFVDHDALNSLSDAQSWGPAEAPAEGALDSWSASQVPPTSDDPWSNDASRRNVLEPPQLLASDQADRGDQRTPPLNDQFTWPGTPHAEPEPQAGDEFAPFADFLIWKQGPPSQPFTSEGSDNHGLSPFDAAPSDQAKWSASVSLESQSGIDRQISSAIDGIVSSFGPAAGLPLAPSEIAVQPQSAAAAASSAPASQTSSFIERYAHMFDDSGESEPPQSAVPSRPAESEGLIQKPRNMGVVGPSAHVQTPADDEESIEQYMAKLLQRVRGDSAQTSEVQMPSAQVANSLPSQSAVTGQPGTADERAQPTATVVELIRTHVIGVQPTTRPETTRRQAPIAQQTADLKAFRAVANESARRAISTHALRKHRRNAVTKTIVATLAGLTSVLLMLEAPDWRDLQFIAACVSLLVAAYWVGQTYGTLLESFRAAAYDGPAQDLDDLSDFIHPALPIDVER